MRIGYKGDYALKAMLELSIRFPASSTINELAKHSDIPIKFLEQVLLDLKHGGFLESRRGVRGGYTLARHPAKITVGEVVRFIEGPVEPIACAKRGSDYKGCKDVYSCVLRDVWIRVTEATSAIIDKVNFEELAQKAVKSNCIEEINYII